MAVSGVVLTQDNFEVRSFVYKKQRKCVVTFSSLYNFFPLGRNVDEALRMVDALQYFEENGEVCPANWHKGDAAMKPSFEGVANYLASH